MVKLLFMLCLLALYTNATCQITFTNYELRPDSSRLSDAEYLTFLARQKAEKEGWMIMWEIYPPNFDGDLRAFIHKNIINPICISDRIVEEEKVFVYLEVDTLGNTFNHQVIRTTTTDMAYLSEALRVCKLIKFTSPFTIRRKPTYGSYIIPIKFEYVDKNRLSEE